MSVLVDTNVLVYAHDGAAPEKRDRAIGVLRRLEAGAGRLTPQVLAEYFDVITRKFATRVSPALAAERLERLVRTFPVLDTSAAVSLTAARGAARYGMHIYDAQIWASALLNDIPVVLSEDFSDGAEIEGVRFVDPFAEGFDLEALLAG